MGKLMGRLHKYDLTARRGPSRGPSLKPGPSLAHGAATELGQPSHALLWMEGEQGDPFPNTMGDQEARLQGSEPSQELQNGSSGDGGVRGGCLQGAGGGRGGGRWWPGAG
jgi:hypothetical protein